MNSSDPQTRINKNSLPLPLARTIASTANKSVWESYQVRGAVISCSKERDPSTAILELLSARTRQSHKTRTGAPFLPSWQGPVWKKEAPGEAESWTGCGGEGAARPGTLLREGLGAPRTAAVRTPPLSPATTASVSPRAPGTAGLTLGARTGDLGGRTNAGPAGPCHRPTHPDRTKNGSSLCFTSGSAPFTAHAIPCGPHAHLFSLGTLEVFSSRWFAVLGPMPPGSAFWLKPAFRPAAAPLVGWAELRAAYFGLRARSRVQLIRSRRQGRRERRGSPVSCRGPRKAHFVPETVVSSRPAAKRKTFERFINRKKITFIWNFQINQVYASKTKFCACFMQKSPLKSEEDLAARKGVIVKTKPAQMVGEKSGKSSEENKQAKTPAGAECVKCLRE